MGTLFLGYTALAVNDALTFNDLKALLGTTDGFGAMLCLDPQWAFRIVKQVGNYAESFERHVTPLGIDRGVNRLWRDGGVLYVPALR